jgi:precorrin-2 dehydrogenase/sirohydrochlorin ferrochelatase
MPRYYPVYLDLSGRLCLVVGGGAVAERRVSGLLEAGATVRIISPTLTPPLQEQAERGVIAYRQGLYAPSSLEGVVLVVAATDSRAVNAAVIADARAARIPVNAADAPEEGDYIVPSVVRRGELCVSISTGGANPMLAARLAEEMESRFGPEYTVYVELLGQMRNYIKSKTGVAAVRRRALADLLAAEPLLLPPLKAGDREAARAIAAEIVEAALRA